MNRIFHEIGHSYVHQTTAYSNNHQSWKKKRETMKKNMENQTYQQNQEKQAR